MTVAQKSRPASSPCAVGVARVAIAQGFTSSEVNSDLALRGRLVLEAGEGRLDDRDWLDVAALITDAMRRAAQADARTAGECRSCGQPVRWVETVNGKRMPLDPLPCKSRGNVELRSSGAKVLAFVHSPSSVPVQTERRVYRAHAATCPRQQRKAQSSTKVSTRLCAVCRHPMDAVMWALGERTHATCSEVAL